MDLVDDLFLIGAGGIAAIVRELVKEHYPQYNLAGYFDDDTAKRGQTVDGIPVRGTVDELIKAPPPGPVVNCIGNFKAMGARIAYTKALLQGNFVLPTLIHPAAVVSSSARVGKGVLLFASTVVNPKAGIGDGAVVFAGCVIEHDARVGNHVYLSPRVAVCGKVTIGEGCYIGPGATLAAGVTIGPNAVIGAGAAVLKDVPKGELHAGVPAGFIRKNKAWG